MGFGNNNNNIAEGVQFSKFNDNASRIKSLHPNCAANNEYCKINNYTGGRYYRYWMSSVDPSRSRNVHVVNRDGSDYNYYASGGHHGLAPCICLPDIILK